MNANLAALLYLVAGILFIMALRGLSSPASSRQGNRYGIAGMGLAVGVTLVGSDGGPIVARALGFVALVFASINIFGGFLVTQRMLAMYQKKKK